jgi:hypothetical protein
MVRERLEIESSITILTFPAHPQMEIPIRLFHAASHH